MRFISIPALALLCACTLSAHAQTWTPDNGNGTFTNPLFYEEFSDPDMIRVGGLTFSSNRHDDALDAGTFRCCARRIS